MLKTLGVVQLAEEGTVNTNGQGDYLNRRLAGRNYLEWIVRRVTEAQRLDGVVVLINDRATYDRWAATVPADVPVCLTDAPDALTSAADVIDRFPCKAAVFVSAYTPFVDPCLIDRLAITADKHPECDYIGYRQSNGLPSVLSQVGVFAEWCKSKALRVAARKASEPDQRDTPTGYLYSRPDRFQIRLLSAPAELDRDDLRLRVSSEEDWENVSAIAEAIGEEALEWQCIAGLLESQSGLRQRMAILNNSAATADH